MEESKVPDWVSTEEANEPPETVILEGESERYESSAATDLRAGTWGAWDDNAHDKCRSGSSTWNPRHSGLLGLHGTSGSNPGKWSPSYN